MSNILYKYNGEEIAVRTSGMEKLNAIASIMVEYGYIYDSSYCLMRIPKTTVDGKRLTAKVAMTSVDGSIEGAKISPLDFAKRENTICTINAGLFYPSSSNLQPHGQTIVNGESLTNLLVPEDFSKTISSAECYPLCIDANGDLSSPYAQGVDTATMIADGIKYAVTGWGQFIDNFAAVDETKYNETVHPYKYIRQVIGQYDNGDYCVCSVDMARNGKAANSQGMTYEELANFLINKGVKYAYSLDGGGSTGTVIGNKQISPIYDGATGRKVPTVIYFSIDD
jgi:exopolysaccharide biosynthesis protein